MRVPRHRRRERQTAAQLRSGRPHPTIDRDAPARDRTVPAAGTIRHTHLHGRDSKPSARLVSVGLPFSNSILAVNSQSACDRVNLAESRIVMNHRPVSRREFLAATAAVMAASATAEQAAIPIIDTHIHFFDTTRPQGVPYSGNGVKNLPIANPASFRRVGVPLGVVGAIEVEASPWVEDNLWVLEESNKDKLIVGTIGNLEPEKPEFREYLGRYHKDPLFLGIRCGNLWGRVLKEQVEMPAFVAGIKDLAAADLTMDTANPTPELIQTIVRLT